MNTIFSLVFLRRAGANFFLVRFGEPEDLGVAVFSGRAPVVPGVFLLWVLSVFFPPLEDSGVWGAEETLLFPADFFSSFSTERLNSGNSSEKPSEPFAGNCTGASKKSDGSSIPLRPLSFSTGVPEGAAEFLRSESSLDMNRSSFQMFQKIHLQKSARVCYNNNRSFGCR